ncbi:MAG TPA: hypothetical protein VGM86_29575 [Thermoanaerobaculia bacterium]|jgi:photosystem II stability/assembly factor-like uncharacterized protein
MMLTRSVTLLTTLTLSLALTAGTSPRIPSREALGPRARPVDERELFDRWMERRHRAAPGYDWRAIEAANLREALARAALAEKAGAAAKAWHERGPVNQTGATAAAVLRPDGKTLLLATSQAGVFSGLPDAGAWQRMTDTLGGYVHSLVVADPPETWVAAVYTYTDTRVYVSRNRGTSWSAPRGLPPLAFVYEMIRDGGNHKTVYLLGQTYNGSYLPFLARSRDGGLSFSVVWAGSDNERPGIWTSRTGAGPLYLLTHGEIFASANQGSSFASLGQVVTTFSNHAVLRGSEAGGPTLYAAIGRGGSLSTLYVSEDGGHTWQSRFTFTNASPNDLRYSGSLAASIQDPNLVFFGAVNGYRSADGGRSFQVINDWTEYYDDPANKLHADVNGIHVVVSQGQERILFGTDGGTYQSTDGGLSFQSLTENSLRSGQIYSTWSSASRPDLFLAGTQDQGMQISEPSGGPAGAALTDIQLISGDYNGLTAASHDLSGVFALYPTVPPATGTLLLFQGDDSGNAPRRFSTALPKFSGDIGFFATSAADPDDPEAAYVAGDRIWRMRHQGGNSFSQSQLPQSFSGDGDDYVSALAIAPSDHNLWYAATVNGHLWYSRDRGATWSESDTTQGSEPQYSSGALAVAAHDPLTCYMGGSGYGTPPVLVTHDGGATWTSLSKGLPSTTVWALAFDGLATQTLYAATEAGPYAYDARAKAWKSLLSAGVPPGRYFSVESVPSAGLVRFGTWSRGVWDYVAPRR